MNPPRQFRGGDPSNRQVPENVLLVRLPPYCPELNPIERLWQDLRKWLSSTLPADLDALKERVATILRNYSKETLASITGYEYLRNIYSAQSV
jgi:transposase